MDEERERYSANTNEEASADERKRGGVNSNEDVAEDFEAHRIQRPPEGEIVGDRNKLAGNSNEDAAEDRKKLASNSNEDAAADPA